jgi:hypothetical protein
MTTKKIFLIAGGVLVVLAVLTTSILTLIVGLGLYSVKNSESALRAKDYLRNSEKLKRDIGEVKDFGSIVTATVNFHDGSNEVSLKLKVIGARKTVNATVDMILVRGSVWRITSASYVDSSGQKIPLLDPYDAKVPIHSVTA